MNERNYNLFTVGPVNMYDYTLETSGRQVPYFRTKEFSDIVLSAEKNLKVLLNAPNGSRVALLTASGTGGMEAVVQTLDKNRKVLVVNGGSFGARFESLLNCHGVSCDVVRLPFDADLTDELLAEYKDDYQAVLVNIHETSIGKYYRPQVLARFAQNKGCYLIIDAISSFLCDALDMSAIGADVVIASSQKALALLPGLSMVTVSERYYEERIKDKQVACAYLDLNEHFKDAERGQTPFTPSLSVIYQLEERTNRILSEGGAQTMISHSARLAEYFRNKMNGLPFELPKFVKSNALTPVICTHNNATTIFETLKNKYGVFVTPSGGANKEKLLRIGHMGDLEEKDYDVLIDLIREENF